MEGLLVAEPASVCGQINQYRMVFGYSFFDIRRIACNFLYVKRRIVYSTPSYLKFKMNRLVILSTLLLAGCASNSGIIPIGKDTYMVSRQAATGFSGSGTLKAEVFREASALCAKQGKSLQVISTEEAQPPFVLGNYPKAEVQFMCLNYGDAELGRPKLKPKADVSVEVKKGI